MESSSRRWPSDVAKAAQDSKKRFGPDGRYVILGELGKGGGGLVLKAYDTELNRFVAIKGLFNHDPVYILRFRREAQLVARLHHPGIVPIFDTIEADGRAHIVMPLVEGVPLGDADLDRRQKVEAIRDAAIAVHYAHSQGVLHRDLKPSNLMCDAQGRTLVMDFGMAREVSPQETASPPLTMSGDVLGTPSFMAPEQAAGLNREIGPRTDVYGLGATLYALLTGRPPHEGASAYEIFRRVVDEDTPPPGVDPELDKICMKAMEKESARRYATAEALADDLDRYLRGEPVSAIRSSWAYRMRRRVKRDPWAWGAALTAAVILVAGGVVSTILSRRVHGLTLSKEATEALSAADQILITWRMERYAPKHDVRPTRRLMEKAIERLRDALAKQPNGHPVWGKLAWTLHHLGRNAEAEEAIDRAVRLAPDEGAYRWWRSQIILQHAEEERAKAQRLELEADRRAVLASADALERRADEEAAAAFRSPSWTAEEWERALASAQQAWACGDTKGGAAKSLDVAQRYWQGGEVAWLLLGLHISDLQERSRCYEKARDRAPSWPVVRIAQSRLLVRLASRAIASIGDLNNVEALYRAAISAADEAIEIDPDRGDAWTSRGGARLDHALFLGAHGGDPETLFTKAIQEDFETAVRLQPGSIEPLLARGTARNNRGLNRFRRGEDPTPDYRDAIEKDLEPALKLNPRSAEAYWLIGTVRSHWGIYLRRTRQDARRQYVTAIEENFQRAIQLDPNHYGARLGRGAARANLASYLGDLGEDGTEQYRLAIEEDYAQALKLFPCSEVHMRIGMARGFWANTLGGTRQETGELFRRAVDEDLTEAIRLDPNNAEARMWRGQLRVSWYQYQLRCGRDEIDLVKKAIDEDLDRAIAVNSTFAQAWKGRGVARTNLGQALLRRGQDPSASYRRAIDEDFKEAIHLDPNDGESFMQRAAARLSLVDFLQTKFDADPTEELRLALEDDLRRASEKRPDDFEVWMFRGLACEHWAYYLRRHGQDPTEYYRRAIEKEYAEACRRAPKSAEPWIKKGRLRAKWANYLRGTLEDPEPLFRAAVEEDFKGALERDRASREALFECGDARFGWASCVYERKGDPTEIIRAALEESDEPLVKANPGWGPGWLGLGNAAAMLHALMMESKQEAPAAKSFAKAEDAFNRAVGLLPKDPDPLWRRGLWRLDTKRPKSALEDFKKSIQLDPSLENFLRPHVEKARRDAASEPEF